MNAPVTVRRCVAAYVVAGMGLLVPGLMLLVAGGSLATVMVDGFPSRTEWILAVLTAAVTAITFAVITGWRECVFSGIGIALVPRPKERYGIARLRFWRTHQPAPVQLRRMLRLWKPVGWVAIASIGAMMFTRSVWHRRVLGMERELADRGIATTFAGFHREAGGPDEGHPALTDLFINEPRQLNQDTELREAFTKAARKIDLDPHDARLAASLEGPIRLWNSYVTWVRVQVGPMLDRYRSWTPVNPRQVAADPELEWKWKPPSSVGLSVVRVLKVLAVQASLQGRRQQAWDQVRRQVRCTDLVGQVPGLLSAMISVAQAGIVASTVAALCVHQTDPGVPEDIRTWLQRQAGVNPVRIGMEAEIAILFDGHRYLHRSWNLHPLPYVPASERTLLVKLLDLTGWLDLVCHETLRRLAEALPLSTARRPRSSAGTAGQKPAIPAWCAPIGESWWWTNRPTPLLIKGLERNAVCQLAAIAAALEEHHRQAGAYPRRLDDLVPALLPAEVLKEPFGDASINFQPETGGRGYVLKSIGWHGNADSTGRQLVVSRGKFSMVFPGSADPVPTPARIKGDVQLAGVTALKSLGRSAALPYIFADFSSRHGGIRLFGDPAGPPPGPFKITRGRGVFAYDASRGWGMGFVVSPVDGTPPPVHGATRLRLEIKIPKDLTLNVIVQETGIGTASATSFIGMRGADGEKYATDIIGTGTKQTYTIDLDILEINTNPGNPSGNHILDTQGLSDVAFFVPGDSTVGGGQGRGVIEIYSIGFE